MTAGAFTIPTEEPESDGTLEWDSTTMVVAACRAGGRAGIGYSYTHSSAVEIIRGDLTQLVRGRSAMDVPGASEEMVAAVRNMGRPGIASSAISAVDASLWDLKAKLLQVSLVELLGAAKKSIPVYGSGGFTSYSRPRLERQLAGWIDEGLAMVKMKVGRDPLQDPSRVAAARDVIGDAGLLVDANGAYPVSAARALAEQFAASNVSWFEEPVSSDHLAGLRRVRKAAPPGMEIAAGEYGYDPIYFQRMIASQAVDVLQADATRCGGITGFLTVGAICAGNGMPLSAHTAPSIHVHPCCSLAGVRHLEYFHDHVLIEHMLFDGALHPVDGALTPDKERPGLGIALKDKDAKKFLVAGEVPVFPESA